MRIRLSARSSRPPGVEVADENGDRAVTESAAPKSDGQQPLVAAGVRGEAPRPGIGVSHHHHFNAMLNEGRATPEQIRGWVANRFYYQVSIPIKDAAILANCTDRAVRRNWVQRILDHDDYGDDQGGIESWLRLAQAVGLSREPYGKPCGCAARCALRRRCVRQFRAPGAVAGSSVLFVDGALRARDPQEAVGYMARALPVDREGELHYSRAA